MKTFKKLVIYSYLQVNLCDQVTESAVNDFYSRYIENQDYHDILVDDFYPEFNEFYHFCNKAVESAVLSNRESPNDRFTDVEMTVFSMNYDNFFRFTFDMNIVFEDNAKSKFYDIYCAWRDMSLGILPSDRKF